MNTLYSNDLIRKLLQNLTKNILFGNTSIEQLEMFYMISNYLEYNLTQNILKQYDFKNIS